MTGFRTMTVGLGLAALLAIGCNCHKNACRPAASPAPCCNGVPGAPERIPPQPAVGDAGPYGPPPVIAAPPR